MLFEMYRFFRGIFGYGSAKRDQRELRQEFETEVKVQRALSEGAGHALSRLEREIRAAEQEDKGG